MITHEEILQLPKEEKERALKQYHSWLMRERITAKNKVIQEDIAKRNKIFYTTEYKQAWRDKNRNKIRYYNHFNSPRGVPVRIRRAFNFIFGKVI